MTQPMTQVKLEKHAEAASWCIMVAVSIILYSLLFLLNLNPKYLPCLLTLNPTYNVVSASRQKPVVWKPLVAGRKTLN